MIGDRRRGQGARLRPRQARRARADPRRNDGHARRGSGPQRAGDDRGHRRLHGTRAGDRRHGRRAQRHLQLRRHALRDGHRYASVCGHVHRRYVGGRHPRAADATDRGRTRAGARARASDPALPSQGPGSAVPDDSRRQPRAAGDQGGVRQRSPFPINGATRATVSTRAGRGGGYRRPRTGFSRVIRPPYERTRVSRCRMAIHRHHSRRDLSRRSLGQESSPAFPPTRRQSDRIRLVTGRDARSFRRVCESNRQRKCPATDAAPRRSRLSSLVSCRWSESLTRVGRRTGTGIYAVSTAGRCRAQTDNDTLLSFLEGIFSGFWTASKSPSMTGRIDAQRRVYSRHRDA